MFEWRRRDQSLGSTLIHPAYLYVFDIRRVYIDVQQNTRGHHVVPPDVLRAVPAVTVSTPLGWREVTDKLDPAAFTLKKFLAPQKPTPWPGS